MRKCSSSRRIPVPRPCDTHGLRTFPQKVFRKPAVKQLSNSELLDIIRQDKGDSTLTATAETDTVDGLDSQAHAIPPQTVSPLAICIPQLPQSPLTDQGLIAARIRHRTVKPLPSGDRSTFQLMLQKNSYAIALATPPRLCTLTGLRLPSYFQISFGVAKHPRTGAPWHLPKLLIQAASGSSNMATSEVTQPSPLESHGTSKTLKGPMRALSSTHFLASRPILAHVSGLTSPKYERMIPFRWKQDSSVKVPDLVWREDMDTFVLEILRRNVSKSLSYLASRPAAYVIPCKSYDGINNHNQIAAVLWLSKDGNASVRDELAPGDATHLDIRETDPPPYAMHYYRTHYIPCYNLAALLGPTQLRTLQQCQPDHYSHQFAVVKLKRNTMKVRLELWKLLGYISQDG